jgi:hypothetical protein
VNEIIKASKIYSSSLPRLMQVRAVHRLSATSVSAACSSTMQGLHDFFDQTGSTVQFDVPDTDRWSANYIDFRGKSNRIGSAAAKNSYLNISTSGNKVQITTIPYADAAGIPRNSSGRQPRRLGEAKSSVLAGLHHEYRLERNVAA